MNAEQSLNSLENDLIQSIEPRILRDFIIK
jgi:hypothetical protein